MRRSDDFRPFWHFGSSFFRTINARILKLLSFVKLSTALVKKISEFAEKDIFNHFQNILVLKFVFISHFIVDFLLVPRRYFHFICHFIVANYLIAKMKIRAALNFFTEIVNGKKISNNCYEFSFVPSQLFSFFFSFVFIVNKKKTSAKAKENSSSFQLSQ